MRLIDADVFKENMDFICDAGGWLEPVTKAVREFVKKHIDIQTTVHPEPHWISCKERLPENYVDVLVWFEYYRYGSYNRLYQTYGIGTYSENYDSWTINHESGWHKLRVIAWQPLPEKFKEEGDKDGR